MPRLKRGMTAEGYESAFPRRDLARVVLETIRPKKKEGAGNAGCSMHPQPRMQIIKQAYERSHHRFTGFKPAFPAQWFYGLLRGRPGVPGLLATVAHGTYRPVNLT